MAVLLLLIELFLKLQSRQSLKTTTRNTDYHAPPPQPHGGSNTLAIKTNQAFILKGVMSASTLFHMR